jgi:transcriptional regulator with XRE-family HTH domain
MNESAVLNTIGKKIRDLRINKAMTQQQLSAKCQIEKAGLSKIESGLINPTVRTLLKISIALDVALAELFAE